MKENNFDVEGYRRCFSSSFQNNPSSDMKDIYHKLNEGLELEI